MDDDENPTASWAAMPDSSAFYRSGAPRARRQKLIVAESCPYINSNGPYTTSQTISSLARVTGAH